jgi:hypothetical protein
LLALYQSPHWQVGSTLQIGVIVRKFLVYRRILGKWSLRDEVYFTGDCDSSYVKDSLINHDGYPSDILVVRAK